MSYSYEGRSRDIRIVYKENWSEVIKRVYRIDYENGKYVIHYMTEDAVNIRAIPKGKVSTIEDIPKG